MREYFQTGRLPEVGRVCTPEYRPFIGCLDRGQDGECVEYQGEDEELWETMLELNKVWPGI